MKKIVALVLVLSAMFALCACGSKENVLVGRWYRPNVDFNEAFVFYEDGTGIYENNGYAERITWSLSGSTLYITEQGGGWSKPHTINIEGKYKMWFDDEVLYKEGRFD